MNLEDILRRFPDATSSGGGYAATCPAHDDRSPSLSIGEGEEGKVLINCHAGCPTEKVLEAVGLQWSDLFVQRTPSRTNKGATVTAIYTYTDAMGTVLYQVSRYEPKGFSCRRPNGQGGWINDMDGVARVLYRLPELLKSDDVVFVVEGEKDVDRLWAEGLTATCNPGGAGKWRNEYSKSLEGREVCVIPDNDDAGRRHAQTVADSLRGIAQSVRILELPDLPPKGDASDWFDAGHTADALRDLALSISDGGPKARTETLAQLREVVADILSRNQSANQLVADAVWDWLHRNDRALVDESGDAEFGPRFIVGDNHALWPLERNHLGVRSFFHEIGINHTTQLYSYVFADLDMHAYREARRTRLARWHKVLDGTLYVSSGSQHLVRAANGELEVLPNGVDGVWFAGDGVLPPWEPTEPVDPLRLAAFRPNLITPEEVPDYTVEVQQLLLRSWLATLFLQHTNIPLLLAVGSEHGGKTTLAKAIVWTFLGPAEDVVALSPDERDFLTIGTGQRLVAYDNEDDAAPSWFPSTLAAAITGLKDTRRKLYTDAERLARSFQAALICTSRSPDFVRSDIAQRTVPLWAAKFQSGRRGETQLYREVQQRRDALLSWGVSTASRILGVLEEAPGDVPVRFVDFTKTVWGYRSLFGGPDVAEALQALARAQQLLLLKSDALIQAVCRFVAERQTWEGTATELMRSLQDYGSDLPDMGGKALATKLRRSRSILRGLGIDVGERMSGNATVFNLTA